MIILAVETATTHQSVAIVENDHVQACVQQEVGSHGERLIPALERALETVGRSLSELDGLAVSAGPGSFTGLRVGLATVSAFRLVTGKPLVMVPTLEGLAWNLAGVEGRICAVLRARAGEIYWAQFQWKGGRLIRLCEDQMSPLAALREIITEPTWMVGEGWLLHREMLSAELGRVACEPADETSMRASAVSIARASALRFSQGQLAGVGVGPRYVQPARAEVYWKPNAAGIGNRS